MPIRVYVFLGGEVRCRLGLCTELLPIVLTVSEVESA